MVEWRLNSTSGTVVFTTGSRYEYDVAIQREHPFVDEIVESGTLYPVIRKILIGGYTYTPTYESGNRLSSDLLTCLPSVVITPITCDSTYGVDPDNVYPFNLIYENKNDGGLNKSRIFTYQLYNDTKYMAVEFFGFEVSEQLKIYYCTTNNPNGTLIENWVHGLYYTGSTHLTTYVYLRTSIYSGMSWNGGGLYPVNYPTNPRIAYINYSNCNPLRFVFKMTDFTWTNGDYLKFEIIGSVFEPDKINTNWRLRLDCVDELDVLSCDYNLSSDVNKINSTPIMVYSGDPECNYIVYYNTLSGYTLPDRTNPNTPWMHRYITSNILSSGNSIGGFENTQIGILCPWKISSAYSLVIYNTGYNTCMNMAAGQTITITKDTTSITFTFSDIADFNDAQSDYSQITGSTEWATWAS